MTIEEIEIIVTAKVEEALREFYKMKPQIMKAMKEVSKEISKVDFNELNKTVKVGTEQVKKQIKSTFNPEELDEGFLKATDKLYNESLKKAAQYTKSAKEELAKMDMKDVGQKVTQATEQISNAMNNANIQQIAKDVGNVMKETKEKLDKVKDTNKSNEIKLDVNNEEALEQITQLEKEIESLEKKTKEKELKLSITQDAADKIKYSKQEQIRQNNPNMKSSQISNRAEFELNSDTSYTALINQADKLNTDVMKYNILLESAKSKLNVLKQNNSQVTTVQEQTNIKVNKLKSIFNEVGSRIKGAFISLKSMLSGLGKILQAGSKLVSIFKKFSPHLGNGIKSLLKYAVALVSIRSIYDVLSSAGQAWLSSQDSGAKQLSANIEYMKYALGSAVAPVIQYVTNLFYQLLKAVQSVIYALFKVNIFAKAGASAYNSMANNANKASKANRSLAGIHSEINNVSSSSRENSGSDTYTPSFDLSEMDNTPNNIIDAIKTGNWYDVGKALGEKLNEAMENIPWDKIQEKAKNIGSNLANFLNGGINTINWSQAGNTFAQGLNTVIYFGYNFVSTFDWSGFGQAISDSINGFFYNVDWATAGQTLGDGIKGIFTTIYTTLEEIDWQEIARDIEEFVKNIDWSGVVKAIFRGIGAGLSGLALLLGTLISDAVQGAKEYFQEKIEECGGNVIAGIFKGIKDAIDNVAQWIYDNVFKPFIDGFKNVFGIHSPSTVMEEQGNFIIEGLKNGLLGIWDKVSSIFDNFKNKVKDKFDEIKTNLGTWAENTKNTIKEWANTSKEKVSSCWTTISTTVKSKIGTLKDNISTGLNDAKSTITSWASNAWTWGKDMIDNMATGIRNNISNVTSAVNSVADKIKSFLGFSEPEDGPLSNFHTYMPDMIDLMTKGIKGGISKVKNELENLTSQMSYTINTPDFNYYGDSVKPYISQNIDLKSPTFLYDTVKNALSSNDFTDKLKVSLALTAIMGNKKIGQIAIDDIKDIKRQIGGDLELLFD